MERLIKKIENRLDKYSMPIVLAGGLYLFGRVLISMLVGY